MSSIKKILRKNVESRTLNRSRLSKFKTMKKSLISLIKIVNLPNEAGVQNEAGVHPAGHNSQHNTIVECYKKCVSWLRKMVNKGTITKNKMSREQSKIQLLVNEVIKG